MTLTFDFSRERRTADGLLMERAPVVPIWLLTRNGRGKIRMDALVDSGADLSNWPVALMGRLGIRSADCEPVRAETLGHGYKMLGYRPNLRAVLLDDNGGGWPWTAAGLFVDTLERPVLGREDFMRFFRPTIDVPNRELHLEPTHLTERFEILQTMGLAVPELAA